jgi:hypothetical protein
MKLRYAAALLLASCHAPGAFASCGSAFCLVNTNWDMPAAQGQPGLRLDLRFESVNQNQPYSGSSKVSVGRFPRDHDELRTANRNWVAGADYTFNADWGLNVALPIVRRDHLHLENDFGAGTQSPENWKFTELGDVRVLARRRLATFEGSEARLGTAGINFGLKLPTGSTSVTNAEGERAERTLQPGTGTTDGLIGAYYTQLLPQKNLSWFAQALLQVPLDQHDGYRPGARVTFDAGLRYELSDSVSLLLQANALLRGRDSGQNADREDSGGRAFFLSPGLSVAVAPDVRVYGFVQAPVYQYVNGVQLGMRPGVVIGASVRF